MSSMRTVQMGTMCIVPEGSIIDDGSIEQQVCCQAMQTVFYPTSGGRLQSVKNNQLDLVNYRLP